MRRWLMGSAVVLVGLGGLSACNSGPAGPIVLTPVDKDIDGAVIAAADRKADSDGGALFGAGVSSDAGRGGLFGDSAPDESADIEGRIGSAYAEEGESGGGGSGGSSGGGLFSADESDRPRAVRHREIDKAIPAERESLTRGPAPRPRDRVKPVDLIPPADDGDADKPGEYDPALSPGRLTAGAINDWPDQSAYHQFIAKLAGDEDNVYQKFTGKTFTLQFLSDSGKPLANATVKVEDPFGDRAVYLRTRTDGRAIVSTRWDLLESREDLLVTVKPLRGSSYTVSVDPDNEVTHTIRAPRTPDSRPIKMVQIALVLDCTGSMGDELEYLKVELKSIAERVAVAYPGVDQRFALVAYRDADDVYVTRTIDFTPGVNAFIEALGQQSAGGGGDEPEAVHRAFSEAAALSWEPGRVARVCVHVADAPPHDIDQTITLRAVDILRTQGVAVYPVASSGASVKAQFTMRTAALLTGGQYLFLTDDSGVGNAHSEPSESAGYAVMPLRDHLLRVIASEIAGEAVAVEEGMVIRRVGGGE
ncbi:MAG: hypothetical protein ACE37H_16680 [Phycisphaeraceae bacterium]